jgi:hypothetical protein
MIRYYYIAKILIMTVVFRIQGDSWEDAKDYAELYNSGFRRVRFSKKGKKR